MGGGTKDDKAAGQERGQEQDLSPYAGRWVAMAGEQVAGVGDTAVAAERLGRRNRLRERLAIYFVEPEGGELLALPKLMRQLQTVFRRHDQPIYLVGGAVRDALLGRRSKDLDFVVPDSAIPLAFKVADALKLPAYVLDRERDAGRVVLPDGKTTLDFSCYRGDGLLDDLRSRDFSINAMALPSAAQTRASLVDPCGGQADLEAGLIRLTHSRAIADDPVRAMRAIRHAADFGFALENSTRDAVRGSKDQLQSVSVERVRDELLKMMQGTAPARTIQMMHELDLLATVLPEVAALADVPQTPPHFESALPHTIRVLDRLAHLDGIFAADSPPSDPRLAEVYERLLPYSQPLADYLDRRLDGGLSGRQAIRLGALFHDIGKATTMTVEPDGRIRFFNHADAGADLAAKRLSILRLSREVIRQVRAIVDGHMRPLLLAQNKTLSKRATFRFFRDTGGAGLDITLLAMADQLALPNGAGEAQWQNLLGVVGQLQANFFENFSETVQPQAILNGRELMETLQLEPGPKIGRLLVLLLEAQAAGEVSTREEAIALVTRLSGEGDR
jgi:putative nucleotidyltransferase with HDIG domain